jgi:hypothetical protein
MFEPPFGGEPGSGERADWHPTVSQKGNVACRFPSEPEFTDLGDGETYRWKPAGSDGQFEINWKTLPKVIDPNNVGLVRKMMADYQTSLEGRLGTKDVVSSDYISFPPHFPARDLVLRISDSEFYRMRMILTHDRMYVAVAQGASEFVEGEDSKTFFRSVRLLNPQK